MKKIVLIALLGIFLTVFATTESFAQKKMRVKFAKGSSSSTVKGRIYGYKYIDYIINAKEGQLLKANLKSKNSFAQFVVFKPNMENLEGSIGETELENQLPTSGDFIIRVLMTRNEARRKNAMADFSLYISIR